MKFFSKNQLKYALSMCGVIVVCLIVMEVTGNNQTFNQAPFSFIYPILAPAIIWYLAITEKKRELKGKMTFKQGFTEGFKLSLLYGILSPFVFLFYYLFVNPEILASVREAYSLKDASNATIISVDMGAQFAGAVIGETLYGAILSFFLRSKNK